MSELQRADSAGEERDECLITSATGRGPDPTARSPVRVGFKPGHFLVYFDIYIYFIFIFILVIYISSACSIQVHSQNAKSRCLC